MATAVLTKTVPDELVDDKVITRMSRDMRRLAAGLSKRDVRILVGYYYQLQRHRIALGNQTRTAYEHGKPNNLVQFFYAQTHELEKLVPPIMKLFLKEYRVGKWLLDVYGIGPVLGAGLVAWLDVRKAKTVGGFWRFCGLDPTIEWDESQHAYVSNGQKLSSKRPWCAEAKRLCYLVGESFVKFSGRDECFYGHVYRQRKELETAWNEAGMYKEYAAKMLAKFNWRKDTESRKCYEQGKLPKAQIHARARRYAVKLFISHLFEAMWWDAYETDPPKPDVFRIEPGKHTHYIPPPHDYRAYDGKKLD